MNRRELIPNVSVPEGTSGAWRVEQYEVPADRWQGFRRVVPPGRYTRLTRNGKVIMSDTPDEKRDHMWFAQRARGNVLINGLGLGMVLGAILRKLEVSSVTIIENSPDVIRLVAPSYRDPRVTIIEADALEWRPAPGQRYDAVWHDIWDDICADNLPEMHKLHRRYGRRAAFQGSWARDLCERQAAAGI